MSGVQAWIKKPRVIGQLMKQRIMLSTVFLNKRLANICLNWISISNVIRQYRDYKTGFWPLVTVLVKQMSYCSSIILRFAAILG
jgi:hypothetical protein